MHTQPTVVPMVDVQPSKALYYPHLDFETTAWVKGALLYWDGLVRLVEVVQPHDSSEILEAALGRKGRGLEAGLNELLSK